MSAIEQAPGSVRKWLAAATGAQSWESVSDCLAENVELELAGRKMATGRAMLIERFQGMSGSLLRGAQWTLRGPDGFGHVTLRAVGPSGSMPSPGGPMTAMDFTFTLDTDGRIARVVPHPHHAEPPNLRAALAIGEVAPDFVLPDTAGAPTPLHDRSAKATLVIFTCNHCPWAVGWHARLQQLARDYSPRGVRVLQINSNDPEVSVHDATAKSAQRVQNGDFGGPYLIDEGQTVARAWGARRTPELFVLDRGGHVAYHGAPDADSERDELRAVWTRDALEAVLAGKSVAQAETKPMGCTIKWTL